MGVGVEGVGDGVVHTTDGYVKTDLVVLGLGVQPNTELAADAGIELGAGGAISVNRRQATSVDGVWAAGDCADSYHLVTTRKVYVALGTVANKQARVAGTNLAVGKAITASSFTFTFVATNANDDNVTTYWEGAGGSYPQNLTVALGSRSRKTRSRPSGGASRPVPAASRATPGSHGTARSCSTTTGASGPSSGGGRWRT